MKMLISILTTFPFHQMPSRPKVWRLDSRCRVTSPLGISPEFDIGGRDHGEEERHVLKEWLLFKTNDKNLVGEKQVSRLLQINHAS